MQQFWIIRNGKPVPVQGIIEGEYASVPLPLGGARKWRWPSWYESEGAAMDAIEKRRMRRLEQARKLLQEAEQNVA